MTVRFRRQPGDEGARADQRPPRTGHRPQPAARGPARSSAGHPRAHPARDARTAARRGDLDARGAGGAHSLAPRQRPAARRRRPPAAPSCELWFTSCVPYRPTERTEARRAATRERIVRAAHGADRPRRLPRGAGRRGRRGRRGRHRQRLPPLPVQGRAVRRGLPARLAARGRRHARRRRRGRRRRARRASPPRSRPSRAARCAAGAWPGRCSPSPSTRPWRSSAWPSAAPTPPASPRSCARASPPASCRPRTSSSPRPPSSARWARRSSVPLSPVADDVDADALVADLVTFCLRSVTEETH